MFFATEAYTPSSDHVCLNVDEFFDYLDGFCDDKEEKIPVFKQKYEFCGSLAAAFDHVFVGYNNKFSDLGWEILNMMFYCIDKDGGVYWRFPDGTEYRRGFAKDDFEILRNHDVNTKWNRPHNMITDYEWINTNTGENTKEVQFGTW